MSNIFAHHLRCTGFADVVLAACPVCHRCAFLPIDAFGAPRSGSVCVMCLISRRKIHHRESRWRECQLCGAPFQAKYRATRCRRCAYQAMHPEAI